MIGMEDGNDEQQSRNRLSRSIAPSVVAVRGPGCGRSSPRLPTGLPSVVFTLRVVASPATPAARAALCLV